MVEEFLLDILEKYKIHIHYKVEYNSFTPDFFKMLQVYNSRGIPISIWATLSDKQGYWINERNAHIFEKYIFRLVEQIEREKCTINGICIDMEPPLKQVQAIVKPRRFFQPYLAYVRMATVNVNNRRYFEATRRLHSVQKYLKAKNIESFATFLRQVYYDIRFNSNIIQNALETPIFSIPWDKYNIMYYATVIREELKQRSAEEVDYKIYHELSFLRERIGEKLCVSVGVTNVGKLGNEIFYQDDTRFIRDIGIVKACGIDDITLFSLDGIMDPVLLEKYLRMMIQAEPVVPEVQEKILEDEIKFKRFIRIAKGYYSLYKI